MQRIFNPSPHHCFTQLDINIVSQTINKHPPISLYAVRDHRIPLFQAVNYSDFKDSREELYLKVKIINQIWKFDDESALSFKHHITLFYRTQENMCKRESTWRLCKILSTCKYRQLKLGEKKQTLLLPILAIWWSIQFKVILQHYSHMCTYIYVIYMYMYTDI